MPKVKKTPKISHYSSKKQAERERERERESKNRSSSSSDWGDTPTPSENKHFDWNIDWKKSYEKLEDLAQQQLLERQGEINWYRQQNRLLKSQLKDWQEWEDATYHYYQEQFQQQEQSYLKWQKEFQDRLNNCCQTELKLEELLARYKKGKISWEQRANLLDRELKKQSSANRKKKKQLQRASLHIRTDQQKITDKDNAISQLQAENNNLTQDKGSLQNQITNLKTQHQNEIQKKEQKITDLEQKLQAKDQKIAELEAEIRELRKPPLGPVNNQTEEKPTQSESNNFLIETPSVVGDHKEELLNTIQQQTATIQQLQTQLKNVGEKEAKVIVKELPVENLTTIQQLRTKLKNKDQTITQLHLIYLLLLGVSILLLTYTALISQKKPKLKK